MRNNRTNKRASMSKKISSEFEKELYWNGNQSYMIAGIKNQYQKMKESKCEVTQP